MSADMLAPPTHAYTSCSIFARILLIKSHGAKQQNMSNSHISQYMRHQHQHHKQPIFPLSGQQLFPRQQMLQERVHHLKNYLTDQGIPSAGKKDELGELTVRA